jgi:hypothetical protein
LVAKTGRKGSTLGKSSLKVVTDLEENEEAAIYGQAWGIRARINVVD